jgi:hypothetical protein
MYCHGLRHVPSEPGNPVPAGKPDTGIPLFRTFIPGPPKKRVKGLVQAAFDKPWGPHGKKRAHPLPVMVKKGNYSAHFRS